MIEIKSKGTGKTALYCRIAGSNQFSDDVIETQLDALHIFAGQLGFENYIEYVDDGFGGNTLNRPAFTRMDADINAGKIDVVIVRSIDRLARDYRLLKKWIDDLAARGVTLIALDGSHESLPIIAEIQRHIKKCGRLSNKRK